MKTQISNSLFTKYNRPLDVKWNTIQVMMVSCILALLGLFAIYCSQLVTDDFSVLIFSRKVAGIIGLSVTVVILHILFEQVETLMLEVINEFLVIF